MMHTHKGRRDNGKGSNNWTNTDIISSVFWLLARKVVANETHDDDDDDDDYGGGRCGSGDDDGDDHNGDARQKVKRI